MGRALRLDDVLSDPRIWRGKAANQTPDGLSTGHAALDAALPGNGWPRSALSEILLPADGIGELRLLLPALGELSRQGGNVVLIDPPYTPFPLAWQAQGLELAKLQIVDSSGRDSLWSAEQCLRAGACAAVLLWPRQVDDRALRRLQVAAESGQSIGFVCRDARHAEQSSPVALRLRLHVRPSEIEVLKCRGAAPPTQRIPFADGRH